MSLAIWGIFAAASAANVSVIVSKLCNAQIFEVRERESAFVSLVYVTGLCRAEQLFAKPVAAVVVVATAFALSL